VALKLSEFVGNLRELFSYVCTCVYWMRDSSIHTELVLIIRPYSYERAGWPRLAFQKFFQILVNFRKSGFQHFSILHFRCFLLVKNYWSRSQSRSRGLGHGHGHGHEKFFKFSHGHGHAWPWLVTVTVTVTILQISNYDYVFSQSMDYLSAKMKRYCYCICKRILSVTRLLLLPIY
jgi:hypothetical protein